MTQSFESLFSNPLTAGKGKGTGRARFRVESIARFDRKHPQPAHGAVSAWMMLTILASPFAGIWAEQGRAGSRTLAFSVF